MIFGTSLWILFASKKIHRTIVLTPFVILIQGIVIALMPLLFLLIFQLSCQMIWILLFMSIRTGLAGIRTDLVQMIWLLKGWKELHWESLSLSHLLFPLSFRIMIQKRKNTQGLFTLLWMMSLKLYRLISSLFLSQINLSLVFPQLHLLPVSTMCLSTTPTFVSLIFGSHHNAVSWPHLQNNLNKICFIYTLLGKKMKIGHLVRFWPILSPPFITLCGYWLLCSYSWPGFCISLSNEKIMMILLNQTRSGLNYITRRIYLSNLSDLLLLSKYRKEKAQKWCSSDSVSSSW